MPLWIMRTQGAARERSARRPTGTVAPATFNASTPPPPSCRRGTRTGGPGRRRLSPSVKGGGWLVGCPVG